MARGGRREGAGRKKKTPAQAVVAPFVGAAVSVSGDSAEPLAYMLDVMNNPMVEADRRDRMAIAAAPYCHPRLDKATQSKKDETAKGAKDAAVGKFATPSAPKLIVNNG